MKPMKFFAALALILSFLSCNKTNEQASVVGDAIIVVKKIDNQVVYGISLYAYTFSSFQSVTVVNNSDPTKTYTLAANQGFTTNFYYETPDDGYTTTKPASGAYVFSAVFKNGATDEFTDELTANVLDVPTITKCEYITSTANHHLEVTWNSVPNADGYAVNIFDETNVVFSSTGLANNIKTYNVSASGSGWATGFTPESGKSYRVRVLAFLYEPNGDIYNVQATSVADTTAVWGD